MKQGRNMPTELPTVQEPQAERCETCRYWHAGFDRIGGVCRKHAAVWPDRYASGWCGEWKPKTPVGPAHLDAYRREVLELLGRERVTADLLGEVLDRLIALEQRVPPHGTADKSGE